MTYSIEVLNLDGKRRLYDNSWFMSHGGYYKTVVNRSTNKRIDIPGFDPAYWTIKDFTHEGAQLYNNGEVIVSVYTGYIIIHNTYSVYDVTVSFNVLRGY